MIFDFNCDILDGRFGCLGVYFITPCFNCDIVNLLETVIWVTTDWIQLDFSISEFSFRKTVLPVFQKTSVGNRDHSPLSRDHSPLSREHLPLTLRPKSVERPIEHLSTKVRVLEKSDCASCTVWDKMLKCARALSAAQSHDERSMSNRSSKNSFFANR